MLSAGKAVTAVKEGATALRIPQSGVTFACSMKDDKPTFKASFPKRAPVISESVFLSNYYGKQFEVVSKAGKPEQKTD